ncbi:hypothetical protein CJJ17_21900 [Gordonia polyisoprenivorans]|nr:hypothetical protein CJJ17_21900 [Gordonia polyisoprenivorans]
MVSPSRWSRREHPDGRGVPSRWSRREHPDGRGVPSRWSRCEPRAASLETRRDNKPPNHIHIHRRTT